ncbi:hypothetical protein, partial [Xanthomonas euvesicatoria]|uniref:hypothetical protein n=1 Tax=Xanthomonas euvesicatoria TaxID=456327 RepID=UPI001C436DA9
NMGKWPQRRSRQLRRFRRSEPPIIAGFFLPSTPHFEAVDAASFEPEGFLRSAAGHVSRLFILVNPS